MADRVNYKTVTLVPKIGASISEKEVNDLVDNVTRSNIFGDRLKVRKKETLTIRNLKNVSQTSPKWRNNPDGSKEKFKTIKETYLTDDPSKNELVYYTFEFFDPQIFRGEMYGRVEDMQNALSELKSSGLFYYVEPNRKSPDTIKKWLKDDSYLVTEEKEVVLDRLIPKPSQPSNPTQPDEPINDGGSDYVKDPNFTPDDDFTTVDGESLKTQALNLDIKTIGMIGGIGLLIFLLIRK